jgi:hypothetical protein
VEEETKGEDEGEGSWLETRQRWSGGLWRSVSRGMACVVLCCLVLSCVWVAPALSKRLEKELPREERGETKTKEEVTALLVYRLSLLLDSY